MTHSLRGWPVAPGDSLPMGHPIVSDTVADDLRTGWGTRVLNSLNPVRRMILTYCTTQHKRPFITQRWTLMPEVSESAHKMWVDLTRDVVLPWKLNSSPTPQPVWFMMNRAPVITMLTLIASSIVLPGVVLVVCPASCFHCKVTKKTCETAW